MDGDSYFKKGRILEYFLDRLGKADVVEAYQKAGVARGKLEQSDIICRAPFETWFCLSVESDNADRRDRALRHFTLALYGITETE